MANDQAGVLTPPTHHEDPPRPPLFYGEGGNDYLSVLVLDVRPFSILDLGGYASGKFSLPERMSERGLDIAVFEGFFVPYGVPGELMRYRLQGTTLAARRYERAFIEERESGGWHYQVIDDGDSVRVLPSLRREGFPTLAMRKEEFPITKARELAAERTAAHDRYEQLSAMATTVDTLVKSVETRLGAETLDDYHPLRFWRRPRLQRRDWLRPPSPTP